MPNGSHSHTRRDTTAHDKISELTDVVSKQSRQIDNLKSRVQESRAQIRTLRGRIEDIVEYLGQNQDIP